MQERQAKARAKPGKGPKGKKGGVQTKFDEMFAYERDARLHPKNKKKDLVFASITISREQESESALARDATRRTRHLQTVPGCTPEPEQESQLILPFHHQSTK